MSSLLVAVAVVFVLLMIAEFLRHKKIIKGELSRKFVHITVGSFVAFCPMFMSWNEIRIMCLAFIIVVLVDRHLHIFKAVHGVKRQTVGDIMFPLGIGLTTYVSSSPWIFTVAVLFLSFGDGVAAIVGNKYGKQYAYSLFRQKKSIVGTIAFWLAALVITSAMLLFMPVSLHNVEFAILFLLPIAGALIESFSIYGIDNVTVPVFVALVLSNLQTIT